VPVIPDILRAKVRVFLELHRKTRQLEDLNRELEDRIAQRTAQLEASTSRCQESEQRLRMALRAARTGAWDLDLDTGELQGSPELLGLLGLPPECPAPQLPAFLQHVHPHDRDELLAMLEAMAREAGEMPMTELEFRVSPDLGQPDEVLWVRLTGQAADSSHGAKRARGILQDVSAHKQLELELAQQVRRKDEFLATLAHELRNPLAAMASGVRLLRTPQIVSGTRERTHALLQRQASHLSRLVDDLLDISGIASAEVTLEREPLDLSELLRTSLLPYLPPLEGPPIIATLPERGPFVSADPVRLAQVVTNLLDNARKFTPPSGRIEVRATESDGQAVLRVSDTGRGIAPHELGHIFELFTQVEPGSSPSGLGIGLSLVRRLVELHGGQVEAHSEGKGLGTEFVVRLPLLGGAAARPIRRAARTSPPEGTRRRVLVVDDNRDAADTLAELLQHSGLEVRVVYDGAWACELGASFEPQLVLLDLGMPGLDGYATARRIRHLPWGQTARLYALTGWGASADRQRTAAAGFDGHLVKPVELEQVLELLLPSGARASA
jgi:signal transduction histidine kinase/ActR/RegA family two-component response regulator